MRAHPALRNAYAVAAGHLAIARRAMLDVQADPHSLPPARWASANPVNVVHAAAMLAVGELLAGMVAAEVGDEDQAAEPAHQLGHSRITCENMGHPEGTCRHAAAEFAERMRNAPEQCGNGIHVQVFGQALCQCGEVVM